MERTHFHYLTRDRYSCTLRRRNKMSKSIIAHGKTTNEAVEKGLKELKVSKDMVEIKTIEDGEKRSFYSILTPRVVKVELTVKENIKKEEEKSDNSKNRNPEKRAGNQNIEEINQAAERLKNFLKAFLKEDIDYEVKIENFEIYVDINGENVNYLIGYRGETINSLQIILSAISNRGLSEKIRLYLDIAGYRSKRTKTLEDLADKIAKTVIRTGKAITLEPMTAYERKIIHTRLQSQNKIKTFSKGEEPYRKIIVALNND